MVRNDQKNYAICLKLEKNYFTRYINQWIASVQETQWDFPPIYKLVDCQAKLT
jgi:hypothetical protein